MAAVKMNATAIANAQRLVAQETADLANLSHGYPANHFAWRVILESAKRRNARRLIEIGVGHGNGVAHVVGAGIAFSGIDNDPGCVAATKAVADEIGIDADVIILADVEDTSALAQVPGGGRFDSLVALGILPSVRDQHHSLRNMAALLRPGGEMFIECRNSLFSLFTFNRFTRDFIMNELLVEGSPELNAHVEHFVGPRLMLDRPPLPGSGIDPAQHNPLDVAPIFAAAGLTDVSVHPFHFHAAQPALESADPQRFRDASLAMEDDTSGWKGLFLCSAFLVRAVRPMDSASTDAVPA